MARVKADDTDLAVFVVYLPCDYNKRKKDDEKPEWNVLNMALNNIISTIETINKKTHQKNKILLLGDSNCRNCFDEALKKLEGVKYINNFMTIETLHDSLRTNTLNADTEKNIKNSNIIIIWLGLNDGIAEAM